MNYKNIISAVLISAGILLPTAGQACQWVRTGDLGERLECRSNYRNFLKDNTELFNKLLMEAAFIALGEAEKITIDSWALRNAVTVPEAQELLQARFEADALLNDINRIVRQQEALDGEMDGVDVLGINTPLQMPSAYMVGVTIPFNGDISKVPFLPKSISSFIPQPGGSAFLGYALIPQKVEFVMEPDGTIFGPGEYVTEKPTTGQESFGGTLGALLNQADEESYLYDYNRIRIEKRFVVIPSIDAKTGQNGRYKPTGYLKPTIGMVFGRNIVRSHQILNHGPSISIPGKNFRMVRNISYLGPFVMPNWLVTPIERYVDTVKVGYSYSSQDAFAKPEEDNIQQFTENAFVWLRFGDRLKRVRPETTMQDVVDGKFRWGWFGVVGVTNDGEGEHNLNGLSGDTLSGVAAGLGGVVEDLLGRSEEAIISEDPKTLKEQIEALEDSLEADEERAEDDADKLSDAVREAIEIRIQELESQLDAVEEAAKKSKKD